MSESTALDGVSISGRTRLIAIVGDPIEHVRSPQVYNPRLAQSGHDAVLFPVHLPSAHFETGIRGLMALANLAGLVITYPFKERALALVDRVERIGARVGAINAMRRDPDGRWTGDIFDGAGLLAALSATGMGVLGRRITLVGAGGAGSAIAFALADAGAGFIHVSDLLEERARRLAHRVHEFYPECTTTIGAPDISGCDLLINATPVGMAPDFALLPYVGDLHPDVTVVDIVPSPERTALLERALRAGCSTVNGRAMIEGQAAAVLEFLGFDAR